MVSWVLGALAIPLCILIVHDLIRRPTIRRLALRNVSRRKGEAALVVAGSLLGTAIITASFIVGDTLRASVRDGARTELGPIDEVVRVTGLDVLPSAIAKVEQGVPGTDGMLVAVRAPAALRRPGQDPRAEPHVTLLELDFDAGRQFGRDPSSTGLAQAGPTPMGFEIVINEPLARTLEVRVGDPVELFAYGDQRAMEVRQIVPKLGLAGLESPTAFVASGTIAAMAETVRAAASSPPTGLVMLSNEGGVFEGAKRTPQVHARLAELIGLPGTEIEDRKQDLLDRADADARQFIQLFGGIGAFSVIAGILLLVNIFVMLADERKAELGMLRAVGLKRNQLVRAFGAEGGVYSLLAAIAGAALGVVIGRVVVIVAEKVFNAGEEERFQVALRFTARPSSLIGGFVIGGVIALLTVWITSLRMGRLNVIRAIRDLPEPPTARTRSRALGLGVLGVIAGGVLFGAGVAGDLWFGALVGAPVAALASVPLLTGMLSRRAAVSWACVVTLAWGVLCSTLFPDVFEGSGIPTFVVQGMVLVAAAVCLGATNADLIGRLLTTLAGPSRGLAPRLAFAYPMARRFRTSMLLGMYALVVFVLTFLAVFSNLFNAQAPQFTEESSAGYDLIADSNAANPATINTLIALPEVATVAPIVRGSPRFSTPLHPELVSWPISGFDRSFLERGHPALAAHQNRFRDDKDTWTAVLNAKDLVIVSDFFLQEGGGPPEVAVNLGDRITAFNPLTNDRREFTVAGILTSDWLDQGAVVSAAVAREFLGAEAVSNRHFVNLEEGQDPEVAARKVSGELIEYGVKADSIGAIVRLQLQQQEGFIRLMQGYLALGLLVGIAGLGVVMVRAVRERRRQIGMLRAMGFSQRVVRTAFLLEAGFVAVQGIVVGVVLALIVSYQLLSNSEAFGESQLDFDVPWLFLGLILGASLAASLIATAAPANQASRIRPAVALRIAE
ncbi:MAG: FtsX-like permease family protein [Actinobacteria bacterium]|nr:FtsX-like permease family protein [Actinomycetota bacterium]